MMGSYSGIDKSMIEQLMQAEKLPLNQLTNKKTNITTQKNAWKDVNTRLKTLFDKVKALQSSDIYTAMTSKSSNSEVASMTASKDASIGSYNINVKQLATNTKVISNDRITSIVSGSFKIHNHGNEEGTEIIVNENDTLQDIADTINLASKDTESEDGTKIKGTGINASIIDNKLVLADESTGERNIGFSGDSSVLDSLKLKNSTADDLGKNAVFTINGVLVEDRTTNSISDVIKGVTIDLKKEGDSSITITKDTEKLTKAIQDFVDQYNSTMSFIEEQLAAGTVSAAKNGEGLYETEGRGVLAGESSLQRLQSSLIQLVTSKISNNGSNIKDISQLGVKTQDRYGKFIFDSSKLLNELEKSPEDVKNFFSSKAQGTDGEDKQIGFVSRLSEQIDSFISSDKGLIKVKNDSFDRTLKDLNKQIDRFNDRMVRKEAYYTKMFTALDVAMMQAESQMSWLEAQVSAMNAQTSANKR